MGRLKLKVNGEVREAEDVWEDESLPDVLRERLKLPGSKNACEQGECGSCSVYMDGALIRSCLVLAGQAEGYEVVTVEGLAEGESLHPVQEAFVQAGAVQCGLCTPGLIVGAPRLVAAKLEAHRRGDKGGARRQPLPLHGLQEDPGRRASGVGEDESCIRLG
jgi:carbon-monoxide dehydrogenase small subunit